jgi:hypothetical protein
VRLLGKVALAGTLAAALFVATPTRADPQGHVALRGGPCGLGTDGQVWDRTVICGGLVGDLLLFRRRNRDVGLGPYVEVLTAGLWDARFGGGASLVLPVTESYPLVISVGAFDHELRAASLGGTLFWGIRSYNFESAYNWTLGVHASAYRDLDARGDTLVSLGIELDGFFVAAPFLLAFQALR